MPKAHLVETALLYLNAPYLWGGRTPLVSIVVALPKWFIC